MDELRTIEIFSIVAGTATIINLILNVWWHI